MQVVWSSRRGSREIEHLGSAHDERELEALKGVMDGDGNCLGVSIAADVLLE